MNKNDIKSGFLTDTSNKVNVYLLGFLWADGWIVNAGYTHSLSMYLIKSDFLQIEPMLYDFGIRTFYDRQRKRKGENFGRVSRGTTIQNKEVISFLWSNDYDKKSGCSPSKILSLIPTSLHHYFWRGYVDGDGCISKKEIALWSVIEQDWSEAKKLTESLGVSHSIYTYVRKSGKHKSSVFRMGGIDNIVRFGDFIYKDYDGIGLCRKYDKYLLLKGRQKTMPRKTSKYIGVFFASRMNKWGANKYNPRTKKQKHLGWFPTEEEAYTAIIKS